MQKITCPTCGHETTADTSACPRLWAGCRNERGRQTDSDQAVAAAGGGELGHRAAVARDAGGGARRTFDEAEYLAGVREIEQGGGVQIDDLHRRDPAERSMV